MTFVVLAGGCAPDRASLDTLPKQVLTGTGLPAKVGECVYDKITPLDCQRPDERLLLQRDKATGDVVVLCDNHPAYAGRNSAQGAGAAGAGGAAGAVGMIIGNLVGSLADSAKENDRNQYAIYSISLRPTDGTGLQASIWALNYPDLAPKRLAMLKEAFNQCTAPPPASSVPPKP